MNCMYDHSSSNILFSKIQSANFMINLTATAYFCSLDKDEVTILVLVCLCKK